MPSISDRVGDLGGYLRDQREQARLSLRQLSHLAGVSNPYLSQVERGLRKPSAEVLQQIANGLRISAEALYIRAGILEGEPRREVELAIGDDSELNSRQKRVLLDIYTAFRAENAQQAAEAARGESSDSESTTGVMADSGDQSEPGSGSASATGSAAHSALGSAPSTGGRRTTGRGSTPAAKPRATARTTKANKTVN